MDDIDVMLRVADKRKPKIKRGTILAVHPTTVTVQPRGSTRTIECAYNGNQAVAVGKGCVYEFIAKQYTLTAIFGVQQQVDPAQSAGSSQRKEHVLHDNVGGEFNSIVAKAVPVAADLLLMEDSADSKRKKVFQVGNLPLPTFPNKDAFTQVDTNTFSNTTAESYFTNSGQGSAVIPHARLVSNGLVIALKSGGTLTTSAGTPAEFTWRVGFYGGLLFPIVWQAPASADYVWRLEASLFCTAGFAGSYDAFLELTLYDQTSLGTVYTLTSLASDTGQDQTAPQVVLSVQMDSADVDNMIDNQKYATRISLFDAR